jgi:hypothetical protein
MSAQDTERAAALERRHRRLLRCYPLASLLFAVLVWPVAIASWRGRVRRSSHALPA